MMKKLLVCLLLSGCVYTPPTEQTIELTLVKTTAEIHELCGKDPLEGFGCAKISPNHCEIVAIKPRGFDDDEAIQTLGHELWHCFHGPIHD